MREATTRGFIFGVQNKVPTEVIKDSAAASALNWLGADGSLELARGRQRVGTDGTVGGIHGEFFAPTKTGTKVHYRKTDTKLQYYTGSAWSDVVTGLTAAADYTLSSYISLAGAFLYATGVDGIYKINLANPGTYKDMYNATKNFKGYSLVNDQRMIMWHVSAPNLDYTALYLSKIDPQGTNYTSVTNEVLGTGNGVQTVFTGTLAQATGTRFVFAISINTNPASVTATDNRDGTITGTGITGTINYATGAYSLTFAAAPALATDVRASYQYEDSNVGGITDFTYTSPARVAGEGDIIPQEYLGEPIQNVIPFEGSYFSLKKTSVYQLTLTIDDTNATNDVFRVDIGIPSLRGAVGTGKGIVFMNTANPSKPVLSILRKNAIGGNLEPINLTPLFAWENYTQDQCVLDTWDEFILVSARTSDSAVNNRTFLVNTAQKYSVDITSYGANCFGKDSGSLYCGDPFSDTVYEIYSGFDDLGNVIENEWVGKDKDFGSDELKRVRFLRLKGLIDPAQSYGIYVAYDRDDYSLVGTIRGDQAYVDYTNPQTIGSNGVGSEGIGGGATATAYPYETEIPLRNTPTFRIRSIKIVALGIGYVSIEWQKDIDILLFGNRVPKRLRQQAWPNLAGTFFNNPQFGQ